MSSVATRSESRFSTPDPTHARGDNSLSRILRIACLVVISVCQVFAADPVVSRVQAKQREGSRMVDIVYDVADPDSPTLTVYLKVSADGGTTWKGPVELVSGDVGRGIVPGGGKRLVWDAGKELGANQFGVKYQYRIGASDQLIGEPGMAFVSAGPFQMGDNRFIEVIPVHTVTASSFQYVNQNYQYNFGIVFNLGENGHGYNLAPGVSCCAKSPVHSGSLFDVSKWNNARSKNKGRVPVYCEYSQMTVVYLKWGKARKRVNKI